jgi:hypothetical protein
VTTDAAAGYSLSWTTVSDADAALIAHWKLDESSTGGLVLDASGNGNDGSHVNFSSPHGPSTDVPTVNYPNPRSLDFDGADDFVSIPASSSFSELEELTVAAWFNTDTLSVPNSHRVIATLLPSTYLSLNVNGAARPFISMRIGGSQQTLRSTFYPEVGRWYHVAATYDGTTMRIYVDGELQNTKGDLSGTVDMGLTRSKLIGSYTTAGREFDGRIDDVRVYGRALSLSDNGFTGG